MSRYKCHACDNEHDTDNLVAICASCVDGIRHKLQDERELARKWHQDNFVLTARNVELKMELNELRMKEDRASRAEIELKNWKACEYESQIAALTDHVESLKAEQGYDRQAALETTIMALQEQVAGLTAAFYRMQEFHDCMEAQRKDQPLPEGHDDPDSSCGDGVCYVVGEIIKRGIKASKDAAPILERIKAEAMAEAFEEAADRCQTRSTDAKLAGMPVVLSEELRSRRIYFLERAARLRKEAAEMDSR